MKPEIFFNWPWLTQAYSWLVLYCHDCWSCWSEVGLEALCLLEHNMPLQLLQLIYIMYTSMYTTVRAINEQKQSSKAESLTFWQDQMVKEKGHSRRAHIDRWKRCRCELVEFSCDSIPKCWHWWSIRFRIWQEETGGRDSDRYWEELCQSGQLGRNNWWPLGQEVWTLLQVGYTNLLNFRRAQAHRSGAQSISHVW